MLKVLTMAGMAGQLFQLIYQEYLRMTYDHLNI